MKKIIILTWLSVMLACQSQNIKNMTPTVDNQFETFDKVLHERIEVKNHISEYDSDNNYIELLLSTKLITNRFTPKDSYFQIIKVYNRNGKIITKGLTLNLPWSTFNKGIWYEFNENGKLIKETNYDEPYKFTFEDILQFCKKENIEVKKGPILQSTGYHTTIRRDVENGKPWWEIRWLKTPDTIETIKLDGETGKVLSRTEQHYTNN